MSTWAERAVEAEVQLKSARARIEELEARLLGLLKGEIERDQTPLSQQTEMLLSEIVEWLKENPSVIELAPTGFYERVRSQLLVVELTRRGTLPAARVGELSNEPWTMPTRPIVVPTTEPQPIPEVMGTLGGKVSSGQGVVSLGQLHQ